MGLRLLAIDGATITCGYAVLEQADNGFDILAAGNIHGKGDMECRLCDIRAEVLELMELWTPDVFSVEDLKFNRGTPNLSSMTKVAFAIGTILSAYGEGLSNYPVIMIPANQVRKSWSVKTKPQLRAAINKKYLENLARIGFDDGLKPKHNDISDAIGLGVVALARTIEPNQND